MLALFNHPFLGRGFRPFFLLAALYAVLSIGLWMLHMYGAVLSPMPFFDPVIWHGHEMIFGFSMAVIAGFLLTAVANWTGGAPARQIHLAGLCILWIAGRIAANTDIDLFFAAVIDLAFIPALTISLAIPLLKNWNKRNFIFLFMLTGLFFCNAAIYIWQDRLALYLALLIITAMVSLVGGRIIPAFTVGALRRRGLDRHITDQPRMDAAALISLVCLGAIAAVWGLDNMIAGLVALMAAGIHLLRMRVYHSRDVWNDPMLWSLHLGYGWLITGLALLGLSGFTVIPLSPAFHALTTGVIGTMTLSMMCRVALGHTGRELIAGKTTTLAFLLIQAAALVRVAGPLVEPEWHMPSIIISAVLWCAAFIVYILRYAPILWQPRPDGKAA